MVPIRASNIYLIYLRVSDYIYRLLDWYAIGYPPFSLTAVRDRSYV